MFHCCQFLSKIAHHQLKVGISSNVFLCLIQVQHLWFMISRVIRRPKFCPVGHWPVAITAQQNATHPKVQFVSLAATITERWTLKWSSRVEWLWNSLSLIMNMWLWKLIVVKNSFCIYKRSFGPNSNLIMETTDEIHTQPHTDNVSGNKTKLCWCAKAQLETHFKTDNK